jgi:DNA-binding beta-propeller fold protein YncE
MSSQLQRLSWLRRGLSQIALLAVLLLLTASLAAAQGAKGAGGPFPEVIPVPNGFHPEGIATGRGHTFYVGSIVDGAIYGGDLRTGEGSLAVAGQPGRTAVGLSVDPRTNYIYVAGGPYGTAYVYDLSSGDAVADYQLFAGPLFDSFVNDVIVTRDAAYFTDSFRPVFYRVPLDANGMPSAASQEIALSGDFVQVPGPFVFNSNGIDAEPNGSSLILANSSSAELYLVDPGTGYATVIDLGADSVPAADGILLDGKTLYVVQNTLNQIAVIELDPGFTSGKVVGFLTSSFFRVPTTVAEFGNSLYAVNARFDQGPPPFPGLGDPQPSLEFEAVRTFKP